MNNEKTTVFDKGIFTLSLDLELAWGMVDKPVSLIKNKKYFYETRSVIDGLLGLLEKYEISATWAVVGSLLLDEPEPDKKFIEHVTRGLDKNTKEQYLVLLNQKEIWSGKDIIQKIRSCSVPQEIGSHSHSHVIFGDENVTKEKALEEFHDSRKILQQNGADPVSFVFPRNSVNHLNVLKEAGYESFRGNEPSWYEHMPSKAKKICHIIDQTFALTPPVVSPIYQNGLVNIPASMLYLSMDGFRRYIPLKSRVLKAHKGIKSAIANKKVFHLWFHPFNISTRKIELLLGLEEILKHVSAQKEKGSIHIMPMGEVAKKIKVGSKNESTTCNKQP